MAELVDQVFRSPAIFHFLASAGPNGRQKELLAQEPSPFLCYRKALPLPHAFEMVLPLYHGYRLLLFQDRHLSCRFKYQALAPTVK